MTEELKDLLILSAFFLGLFAISEILYHKFRVKVELTRKLVHVGTGVLTLLFPIWLESIWAVLFLCGSFLGILMLTLKYNLLQSVNAIRRQSVGSLMYPVAVSICFAAFTYFNRQYIFFYVPILILAFCDPIAALGGKRFPFGKYRIGTAKKTLVGSALFFLTACLVYFLIGKYLNLSINNSLIISILLVSLATTIAEAVTGNGYDNLTIPLAALGVLALIH